MPTVNQTEISFPSDYPSRLDPFLVKELRLALRHRWFLGSFLFVHVIMLLAVSAEWLCLRKADASGSSGPLDGFTILGRNGFWIAAHLIMGLVLGGKMEETLKQSLIIFGDDVSMFATRPIAMTLLCITAIGLLWPLLGRLWRMRGA